MRSDLADLFFYNFFHSFENCSLLALPALFIVLQRLHNEMSVKVGAHGDDLSAVVVELAYPRICVLKK